MKLNVSSAVIDRSMHPVKHNRFRKPMVFVITPNTFNSAKAELD
jgi:hypothetical protein